MEQGYRVSGSDQRPNDATDELGTRGVTIYRGHHAGHVKGADLVLISSAVPQDNPEVLAARAVIVIAGMEGALASVVGGLVPQPVVAVPTSVGYGASFAGLSALLGMLTSCASGVTVTNIDNGFGAACAACRIINACEGNSKT